MRTINHHIGWGIVWCTQWHEFGESIGACDYLVVVSILDWLEGVHEFTL